MVARSLLCSLALLTQIFMSGCALAAFPQVDKPTVLITGANTGHGLAFVEEYSKLGWNVIATCRKPAEAERLNAWAADYPNVVVDELDIVDDAEIAKLTAKYAEQSIDVLLLNGAINAFRFGMSRFGKIDYEFFEQQLVVNIIGQLKVAEAFLPQVEASDQKTIVAMTSSGGSIADTKIPINPGYRTSKAGLNMAMKNLALHLEKRKVIVGIVAPGTVDTEDYMNAADPTTVPRNYQMMIRGNMLAPRTAINDMITLINGMTIEDSGVFYQWDGAILPW